MIRDSRFHRWRDVRPSLAALDSLIESPNITDFDFSIQDHAGHRVVLGMTKRDKRRSHPALRCESFG